MSLRPTPAGVAMRALSAAAALISMLACSTQEKPQTDSAATLVPAPADTTAATADTGLTPVRGRITAISDTEVVLATATGSQQIRIAAPLHLYTRQATDLAHVKPDAFVGVTSVAQPDGSQRATEIHVFPEELRGMGEGSRPMGAPAANGSTNTMTNGSVAAPRMTNGSVSGSRMTNGSVATKSAGTSYTIQYKGGTQTITVPAGVSVTEIAPTSTKPAVGSSVVVLAKKGSDGRLTSSTIMSGGAAPARAGTP